MESLRDRSGHGVRGQLTLREILSQPQIWPDAFARMQSQNWPDLTQMRGVICGAGSSAYASAAVQAAWPRSKAVPTTDLLCEMQTLKDSDFLLSLGRSGDSPESSAVVEMAQRRHPGVAHFCIICNPAGKLGRIPGMTVAYLDPRTNDRSLVMTNSFTNLALAGLSLKVSEEMKLRLATLCERVQKALPALATSAAEIVSECPKRAVALASPPLFPWAQEAGLKIMEMTGGTVPAIAETYLGLRHGPMSFVDQETLVLCLLSNDRRRRRYELDLIAELRCKNIGKIVGIANQSSPGNDFHVQIEPMAPELPDHLRAPFEIVFPQLLAYQCSLLCGLDPDCPSPDGIITRVVPEIRIH
jgi:tagatose-6-phosphate ketose/aldose isomerase